MLAAALGTMMVAMIWVTGPAGLLGLIGVLVALSFALAGAAASPRPAGTRPGPARRLRLWTDELLAAWATTLVLMPLERWLMRRRIRGSPGGPVPVLLVHGYVNNAGALFILWRAIRAAGHGTYTVNLEPVYAGIDAYAAPLERALADVQAQEGGRPVALVCHSMGGLAARAYLRRYGGARVARLITLGTPHHGTVLARTALGENGRQMRPGSAWLRALDAHERGRWPCAVTSIYSRDDNIVAPQLSAHLEGARNVAVDGIGHVSLPMRGEVVRLVVAELAGAPPAQAGGQAA